METRERMLNPVTEEVDQPIGGSKQGFLQQQGNK
jgi:hypothetical protein